MFSDSMISFFFANNPRPEKFLQNLLLTRLEETYDLNKNERTNFFPNNSFE